MDDSALKLENQLCFPLYAAARKVTGLYTPYLKEIGLTYTQYLVMMILWEKRRDQDLRHLHQTASGHRNRYPHAEKDGGGRPAEENTLCG